MFSGSNFIITPALSYAGWMEIKRKWRSFFFLVGEIRLASCIQSSRVSNPLTLAQDLSLLDRDLSKVLVLDVSRDGFRLQPNNGLAVGGARE